MKRAGSGAKSGCVSDTVSVNITEYKRECSGAKNAKVRVGQ